MKLEVNYLTLNLRAEQQVSEASLARWLPNLLDQDSRYLPNVPNDVVSR
jgi:hypothetical protein